MVDSHQSADKLKLSLTSPAFESGGAIPIEFSCKGRNINPPLTVANVPKTAGSLALVVHDPDAVSGDFVHWLVWGISPSTTVIATDSLPDGAIQGANDAGQSQYMGPCPPAGTGTHHYLFELYALDKMPELAAGSNRYQLEQAMAGHVLAKTTLIGLFGAQP